MRLRAIPRPRFAPPLPLAGRRAPEEEAAAASARERAALASALLAQLLERGPEGMSFATLAQVLEAPRPRVEEVARALSGAELLCVQGSQVSLGRGVDELADHSRGWRGSPIDDG